MKDGHDMDCEVCRLWRYATGCEAYGLDQTEMHKLHNMLTEAGIPHDVCVHLGGYQVCYPSYDHDKRVCSAILNKMSYGAYGGRIEICGLLTPEEEEYDSVCGYLTADDVFNRIEKHWKENKA